MMEKKKAMKLKTVPVEILTENILAAIIFLLDLQFNLRFFMFWPKLRWHLQVLWYAWYNQNCQKYLADSKNYNLQVVSTGSHVHVHVL